MKDDLVAFLAEELVSFALFWPHVNQSLIRFVDGSLRAATAAFI